MLKLGIEGARSGDFWSQTTLASYVRVRPWQVDKQPMAAPGAAC